MRVEVVLNIKKNKILLEQLCVLGKKKDTKDKEKELFADLQICLQGTGTDSKKKKKRKKNTPDETGIDIEKLLSDMQKIALEDVQPVCLQ